MNGLVCVGRKPSFNPTFSPSLPLSLSLSVLHCTIHEYLYAKDCELFMHKQKHSVMHIKFFGNLNRAEIRRQWFLLHTRETRRMYRKSQAHRVGAKEMEHVCKKFCTSRMYAVHVFDEFFFLHQRYANPKCGEFKSVQSLSSLF